MDVVTGLYMSPADLQTSGTLWSAVRPIAVIIVAVHIINTGVLALVWFG